MAVEPEVMEDIWAEMRDSFNGTVARILEKHGVTEDTIQAVKIATSALIDRLTSSPGGCLHGLPPDLFWQVARALGEIGEDEPNPKRPIGALVPIFDTPNERALNRALGKP